MARLYQSVANTIRERIASGRYRAGGLLPSERQLCGEFGVSRVTIRRSLAALKYAALITSAMGTGHYVGLLAQAARGKTPATAALVVTDVAFCTFSPDRVIFAAIRARLAKAARDVTAVMLEHNDFRRQARRGNAGDVAVLFSEDRTLQRQMLGFHIPFAIVGRPHRGINAPWVDVDQRRIGYQTARHLLRLGHRRMAMLYHEPTDVGGRLWLEGMHKAFAEQGCRADPAYMFGLPQSAFGAFGEIDESVLRILGNAHGKGHVTAILASTGWLANGAIRAAAQLGLAIPRDLSLAAGETPPAPRKSAKPITACLVDYEVFGTLVAETVLELLDNPGTTAPSRIVPHRFMEGWSSIRLINGT